MMDNYSFPHDWSAERALAFAELLYEMADEILRQYEGSISFYYHERNEMRGYPDPRQLTLPFPPFHNDDLPF